MDLAKELDKGRSANEFPSVLGSLKPLCRRLRRILFPLGPRGTFKGTPKNPDVLYGPMIEAFDEAILKLSDEPSEFSEGG